MKYSVNLSGGGRLKNYTPQGVERYYEIPAYGFTLAEVLITLGIIGVVAAMTIPNLISNYQDKVLETRYKKAKNILINGYKLMMAKEQVFDVKNLSMFTECRDMDCVFASHKSVFKILRDSASSDMSTAFAEEYTVPNSKENFDLNNILSMGMPTFQTTDGMSYLLLPDTESLFFYTDLNGDNKPNIVNEDFFLFSLSGNAVLADMTATLLPDPPECTPETISTCKTEEGCEALGGFYEDADPEHGTCLAYGFYFDSATGTCTKSADYLFSRYCK